MKKKSNKTVLTIVLVTVVAFGLLGFGSISRFLGGDSSGSSRSTREIAMSCTLDAYTQFHIHPHLRIIINGAEQTIPANVGSSPSCLHPLHMHDTTGTIHIESPEQRDFTLADFFAVWDKKFSRDQILDSVSDAKHEIVMTIDGQPNNAYQNLILKDKQEIVIEYRTKK